MLKLGKNKTGLIKKSIFPHETETSEKLNLIIKDTAGIPADGYKRGTIVLNTVDKRVYYKIYDSGTIPTLPDIAYYKLNEAAGTSVADSSGKSRTATASTAQWFAGYFNNGYKFVDLAGDTITTPFDADFSLSSDFTIEMWVKYDGSHAGNAQTLFIEEGGGYRFAMGDYLTDFRIRNGISGAYDHISYTAPTANVWTHYAVVGDRTNSIIKIYKDGVLDNSGTWSKFPDYTARQIRFGVGDNDRFAGLMDEIKIWNRVKTASEIVIDMNSEGIAGVSGWGYINLTPA